MWSLETTDLYGVFRWRRFYWLCFLNAFVVDLHICFIFCVPYLLIFFYSFSVTTENLIRDLHFTPLWELNLSSGFLTHVAWLTYVCLIWKVAGSNSGGCRVPIFCLNFVSFSFHPRKKWDNRGAQIPIARSPRRLHFIPWHLVLLGFECWTCFIYPSPLPTLIILRWALRFWRFHVPLWVSALNQVVTASFLSHVLSLNVH